MKTKKIFFAIIIFFISIFNTYSQFYTKRDKLLIETKREKIKKSNIKSKTLLMFLYRNDTLSKKGFRDLNETEQYDTNGNTILKYLYKFSGGFIKIKSKYDDENRILESIWCLHHSLKIF